MKPMTRESTGKPDSQAAVRLSPMMKALAPCLQMPDGAVLYFRVRSYT
jgi:hypothetical protein